MPTPAARRTTRSARFRTGPAGVPPRACARLRRCRHEKPHNAPRRARRRAREARLSGRVESAVVPLLPSADGRRRGRAPARRCDRRGRRRRACGSDAVRDRDVPARLGESADPRCLSFLLKGVAPSRVELYDLSRDAASQRDLSREHSALAAELAARLGALRFRRVADPGRAPVDPVQERRLRALGYVH